MTHHEENAAPRRRFSKWKVIGLLLAIGGVLGAVFGQACRHKCGNCKEADPSHAI